MKKLSAVVLAFVLLFGAGAARIYAAPALNTTAVVLEPGQRENIRITGDFEGAVWEIDAPDICRLIGKTPAARAVEALKPGNAVLTARKGGETLKCNITVIGSLSGGSGATLEVRGEPKEIPEAFWGIHYGNIYDVGRAKSFVSDAALGVIEELGFSNVRGPGGTEANYYMHALGSVIPYNHPDIVRFYGHAATELWFTKNCLPSADYPPYYIRDVLNPALHVGADYVYNGNIAAYSPAEVVELIKEIRKHYKGTIRYEFGNEIYDLNQSCGFETVDEYIAKCRQIYNAVKEYDSEVEIGVVAVSPEMEERIVGRADVERERQQEGYEKTQRGRVALWNRTIAQNPDFYDAVIVHTYIEVDDFDGVNQDSLRRQFFAYNKYTEDMYPELAEFFGGKPIWITEWSVLFNVLLREQNLAERARLQFMKTPAVAVCNADKALSMLRSGVVSISSYHSLESAEGFGLFDMPTGYNPQGNTIKLPNYYAFKALGEIFKNYKNYFEIDMVGGDVADIKLPAQLDRCDVPDVGALGFGNGAEAERAVFINRTQNPITISLSGFLISPYLSYGGKDSFEDFLDFGGASYLSPPPNVKEPAVIQAADLESVILPPFTMMCAGVRRVGADEGRPAAEANYEYVLARGAGGLAQARLNSAVVIGVDPPAALVGGKIKELRPENGIPFIENDRLFMPIRFVSEGFNLAVTWDGDEQSVRISGGGRTVKFIIGQNEMLVDGDPVPLDAAAKLVDGRVFVPLRALSEGLGKNVFWDERGMVFIGEENNILDKSRDAAVINAIINRLFG